MGKVKKRNCENKQIEAIKFKEVLTDMIEVSEQRLLKIIKDEGVMLQSSLDYYQFDGNKIVEQEFPLNLYGMCVGVILRNLTKDAKINKIKVGDFNRQYPNDLRFKDYTVNSTLLMYSGYARMEKIKKLLNEND